MKLPRLVRTLGSMRVTSVVLLLSCVLVFFGTLDQVRYGISATQILYFESLLAFWNYPETWPGGTWLSWLSLPIPGGYLLGPIFLLNLLCAHLLYFRPRWDKAGIASIHAGLAILLIGQLVTNLFQEDHFMWLREGETGNYLQSFAEDEIVIRDLTDPDRIGTVSFPFQELAAGDALRHPRLPFSGQVLAHFPNARLHPIQPGETVTTPTVTAGVGAGDRLHIHAEPVVTTTDERNLATAIVSLRAPGTDLGTWLVCNAFEDQMPPQRFAYQGRQYDIALRFAREPLPFSLTLLDFRHERYPGSEIPRRFASRVRLQHPAEREDREVEISMNRPLRYDGRTFYQASFAQGDTASMFQVVQNPGRSLPYVASGLITLGIVWQFAVRLRRSGRKEAAHS